MMFNLFKKKSNIEQLIIKYKNLMKEAHSLSSLNRKVSNAKYSEAEKVLQQIEKLQSLLN